MTGYRYVGPISGVTLPDGAEVLLHPGAIVSLPSDNEYVTTLAALGYLISGIGVFIVGAGDTPFTIG